MSTSRPLPAHRVPTLTEVVELPAGSPLGHGQPVALRQAALAPMGETNVIAPAPAANPAPLTEGQLSQRVLADVQHQLDATLEQRLRDVLEPTLARLSDAMVREASSALAATLHDMVAQAVTREISRHRNSPPARSSEGDAE